MSWACCLCQVRDAQIESSVIHRLHKTAQVCHSCELVPKPAEEHQTHLRAVSLPVWGELFMWDTYRHPSQARRVIETHLKYYQGRDSRGLFYGLFMHEAVSLWQGLSTVTSCHSLHDAWRLRVSDSCGIKKRVIPGPQSRWKTFM